MQKNRKQNSMVESDVFGIRDEVEPMKEKRAAKRERIQNEDKTVQKAIKKAQQKKKSQQIRQQSGMEEISNPRILAKDIENEDAIRREIRRRRRIRSQTTAFGILTVVIAAVVFFGILGGKKIMNGFSNQSYNINNEVILDETGVSEVETSVILETFESNLEESIVPARDELDDVVDAYLADMTLEEKVSQMFIITPESLVGIGGPVTKAGAKREAAFQKIPIGGVLLQSQNLGDEPGTKDMLSKMVGYAQRPIFTTILEEGGKNSTLAKVSTLKAPQTDSFQTIGATGDANKAYEAGKTTGTYLAGLGFSLDLAPVADLAGSESPSGLGDSSFGEDPEKTAEMVASYVKGAKEAGIEVCLTHFPGQGSATANSTEAIAYSENSLDDFMSKDYIPFKAGIEAGAGFVMVGHVCAVNVTGDTTPASLSSIFVTEQLRNQLGFNGVVITDRFDYPYISEEYGTEVAVLMAVQAGVDIILCPDDYERAYNALLTSVSDGTISEDRINESLHRIYRVKLSNAAQ